jgi:hypothetical protein
MIDTKELKLSRNISGDEVWVCGHCGQQADEAVTIDADGHPTYRLMCPLGKVTLGEWPTLEEKQLQLGAYMQVLRK